MESPFRTKFPFFEGIQLGNCLISAGTLFQSLLEKCHFSHFIRPPPNSFAQLSPNSLNAKELTQRQMKENCIGLGLLMNPKEQGPPSILRSVGTELKPTHGYGNGTRTVQQGRVHTDDILNINVGGKKYTVRRTDLLADPRSKLADWFRPGTTRMMPSDKGGNYFLDRDSKTFRHIMAYLRFKKEKCVSSLDELAKLVGECEALNLVELREMALEMLQKYQRTEEQHYVTSYVQMSLRDFDAWQFEKEQAEITKVSSKDHSINSSAYDEWDNV